MRRHLLAGGGFAFMLASILVPPLIAAIWLPPLWSFVFGVIWGAGTVMFWISVFRERTEG